MAKKGKLLAALDAHKGRNYSSEKQKKQQKHAAKKKRTKAEGPNGEEKENFVARPNATAFTSAAGSDDWESYENETAEATIVCKALWPHTYI